jgi:hypothetical protein
MVKGVFCPARKTDRQTVLMQHLEGETMNVEGREWIWD